MKIAGLQKNSFVDYRGKVAAVVFTPGCNMNCYFCHNRGILCEKGLDLLEEDKVLEFLAGRKRFLDGVVITGGEPTLQKDLKNFIRSVKAMGYPVKLDTNGTNPVILGELIGEGLLDYVAMDIKAPVDRYEEVCCVPIDTSKIEESIDLLMEKQVDYEFRTTVVPELLEEDILRIADRIRGAGMYILQQYRRPELNGDIVDYRLLKAPHSNAFIKDLTNRIRGIVANYETRGAI